LPSAAGLGQSHAYDRNLEWTVVIQSKFETVAAKLRLRSGLLHFLDACVTTRFVLELVKSTRVELRITPGAREACAVDLLSVECDKGLADDVVANPADVFLALVAANLAVELSVAEIGHTVAERTHEAIPVPLCALSLEGIDENLLIASVANAFMLQRSRVMSRCLTLKGGALAAIHFVLQDLMLLADDGAAARALNAVRMELLTIDLNEGVFDNLATRGADEIKVLLAVGLVLVDAELAVREWLLTMGA